MGLLLEASERSSSSVAGAGDVNGDGVSDVIVGAAYDHDGAGASYVVFGFEATSIDGGVDRDVLMGSADEEVFNPGGGFDFITSGG